MILLLMACFDPGASLPTATATRGLFEVRLSVNGSLNAAESKEIVAPEFESTPEIAWIIEEGKILKKGDRVVEFDRESMVNELDSAENDLRLALTKMTQERAKLAVELKEARADIHRAELDLQVAQMRITDSETVPLIEREQAKVARTKAEMAIDAARTSLKTIQLNSDAQLQLLQLEVDQNKVQVKKLREQLEKAVLYAPTPGIAIIGRSWSGNRFKVGSRPWRGQTLVKLPDLTEMQVEAWAHEVDTPLIALKQSAEVTLDAYPDKPVHGVVTKVADLAVAKGDDEVKYLKFKVTLDEARPEMKPGMTARVDLTLLAEDNVISVPLESVFHTEDESYVMVAGLTGWTHQVVSLGIENDTHVVVKEGLEEGVEVALVNPESDERPTTDKKKSAED